MTTSLFLIILFMVALLPANIIKESHATAAAAATGSAWQSVVIPDSSRLPISSLLHHSPTDIGQKLSSSSSSIIITDDTHPNERNQQTSRGGLRGRRIVRAPTINQEYLPGELLLPQLPLPPPLPASSIPLLPKPFAEKQNIQHNGTTPPLCGGYYRAAAGTIQTPNFPHRFKTPIECIWIIDASEIHSHSEPGANVSIVVYLTQLYVLGGLKFTEYMYYSDDYKVPSHRLFQLTEDDATKVAWIQFTSQYLEIRFEMQTVDGTHLRALDRLLDVYGFNITYEVDAVVKAHQCNALQCRFLGHCWANAVYTAYNCSCFPGFSGSDCGHGPLCDDPHTNFCQNGGTCKHIGDAAITCHCPSGFKGNKCEISEINEITKGCTGNSSIDCHKECYFQSGSNPTTKSRKNITSERIAARTGKTRFEVTIRLGTNLTAFYRSVDSEKKASEHLPSILERHMSRILRNFNITRITDLELISNTSDRLDITFHFFGVKTDSTRIREAITRMVERGRIGNITLVSNFHLFDENPPLKLLDVTMNKKSPIREKSEFVLSCAAQGSSRINFQWYKDGAIVNTSKATREIWTTVLPPDNEHFYTAILGVTHANLLDEGVYTCKVVDWSVEQCRSIHVHIQTPPRLRVDPASVTLHRGDSLRVRCLSPGNDIKRYGQLGYSWTRNGVLFQSDPQTVMWEDLYPDGSILKINNIQKSAEYSCVVSNSVSPVSKSVYVTVIDRNMVELCHAEMNNGVQWPTTAPGAAIVADCPTKYQGYSRRVCEKRDIGNTTWLQPDFSQCVADQLLKTYNQFQALTSGYQKTNVSAILKSCLQYIISRHDDFLLGEAGFLLDMLQNVGSYLEIKGTQLEREMAAEIVLHILDKVMLNVKSLNSQKHIKKLQFLTQWAALSRETIAASQLATSTSSSSYSSLSSVATLHSASSASSSSSSSSSSSVPGLSAPNNNGTRGSSTAGGSSSSSRSSSYTSAGAASGADNNILSALAESEGASVILDEETLSLDRLSSLRTYMTAVKTLPFNLKIYGDDLFSDQLYMDITLSKLLLSIMANSTIFASVISYKNLKSFLPKTYFSRGSDSKDTDYILASRVVQTWLFQSNRSNDNTREPLDLPLDVGHVEIIFQHEPRDINSDWIPVCGHDYKATFESTWRTEPCITKNLMANITRCICPLSGTFVVLLAKKTENINIIKSSDRPIFVIIGCGCCFLQSCTAFIVLLPIWYHKKCCVTFLKMQFCTSTSSIMVIFLLGFLKMLPQDLQGIISSTLASLMLLGISTIIAIALVVHSQLVPRKLQVTNLSSGIRGAVGISWLLPFLFAICSPLISNIIGKWPKHWWLDVDSSVFVLFVVVEMLLIVPFGLLLFILIRKLLWLLRKHGRKGTMLWERIGLLCRSGMILFLKLSTDSLFIIYLNTKENSILSYVLGISCTLLGFSVLFCFVIKAEQSLRSAATPSPSSKCSANLQGNYCSGSINSPLSFYTNYEKEKDNESGASLQHSPPDASVTQLPLTTISTAPRCQMVAGLRPAKTVETFLGMVVVRPGEVGGGGGGGGGCLPLGGYSDKKTKLHEVEQYHTLTNVAKRDPSDIKGGDDVSNKSLSSTDSNTKSRCCNILLGVSGGGGNSGGNGGRTEQNCENETFSWQRRPHEVTTWDLYNAYTPTAAKKGRPHQYHQHQHHHQQQHQHQHGMSSMHAEQIKEYARPESPDFVAVKTLDILQGVSPDSIIGIRTSMPLAAASPAMTTSTTMTPSSAKPNDIQHFKPFVENLPTMTTSLTKTQAAAPQSQKHVTIAEIQKLTHSPFDHHIMPTTATGGGAAVATTSISLSVTPSSATTTITDPNISYMSIHHPHHPPIIMITSSSMDHGERIRDTGVVLTDRLQQNRAADNMKETYPSAAPATETVDMSAENKAAQRVAADGCSSSSCSSSSDGMLDRISHDLDYLLNRTNDVPPPPSSSSTTTLIHVGRPSTTLPSSSTSTSTSTATSIPPTTSMGAPTPPPPPNLTSISSNECDSCAAVPEKTDLGAHHEVISIPPPPLPPSGSIPITISSSCSTLRSRISSVLHEVIMEDDAEQEHEDEQEQELD